jgi:DNA polymerase-3 subunit alpha
MNFMIFDTETNGLPITRYYGYFPVYTDLNSYNNARVVQVSYIIADRAYNQLEESDTIIKRDNFEITNHQFHGITEDISERKGISFLEFAKSFGNSLDLVDTIIAHNINFDFNVLCAEFHRYNLLELIQKIESKRQVCTMKRYKYLVSAKFKNSNDIKDPNLKELYRFATGFEMQNHHNSMHDTRNLHQAIKQLELKYDL